MYEYRTLVKGSGSPHFGSGISGSGSGSGSIVDQFCYRVSTTGADSEPKPKNGGFGFATLQYNIPLTLRT